MNLLLSLLLLTTFPEIDEKIPAGPFCYSGATKREVIVVDPEHSPLLKKACEDLQNAITGDAILQTYTFVGDHLFDINSQTGEKVHQLIRNFGDENCEIPLDAFLEEKSGVCRHIALTTTFLLQTLIDQNILEGEVFLIRDMTPFGRHAWTLLLTKDAAWHLDPFWEILEDGKTGAGFSHLCKKYGERTMQRQKARWEDAH